MWNKAQINSFAKKIQADYAGAWWLLSPPLRIAVVEHRVLQIVFQQDAETVNVEDVRQLCMKLHEQLRTV